MPASRFPRIVAALNVPNDRLCHRYNGAQFLDLIVQAEMLTVRGSLTKMRYTTLRHDLNRMLVAAWERAIAEVYIRDQKRQALPDAVADFFDKISGSTAPQLHTLVGKHRKLTESPVAHALISDMRALLHEMLPLADLNAALRTRQERQVQRRVGRPTLVA